MEHMVIYGKKHGELGDLLEKYWKYMENMVIYGKNLGNIYGDLWEIASGSASHSELEAMDHRNR